MAYNEKASRTISSPMHHSVYGITLCGVIIGPKWHIYRFGGPADCKRCNKIEEREQREVWGHDTPRAGSR